MKFSRLRVFSIAALTAITLAAQTVPSSAHSNGAAIAAGIIGLALGAAVADSAHSRDANIYGGPPPAAYGQAMPFSPSVGVTCYPSRRQCLVNNGVIAWNWTDRIYPQY